MSEIASTSDFVWTGGDPPLDAHTLNACLARVIGLRWGYCIQSNEHGYFNINGEFIEQWNPFHDANQMEEVEAWLRENKWTYRVVWYGHTHEARIGADWDDTRFVKYDKDKKRAFALAVQEMEQSNNNNKED